MSDVVEGSPAAQAGLRAGDVILAYDGSPLAASVELPQRVGGTPVGKRVPVVVWRDGGQVTLRATIEALTGAEVETSAPAATPAPERAPVLDITVFDLGVEQRREAGLGERGVVVHVRRDTPRGGAPGNASPALGELADTVASGFA